MKDPNSLATMVDALVGAVAAGLMSHSRAARILEEHVVADQEPEALLTPKCDAAITRLESSVAELEREVAFHRGIWENGQQ